MTVCANSCYVINEGMTFARHSQLCASNVRVQKLSLCLRLSQLLKGNHFLEQAGMASMAHQTPSKHAVPGFRLASAQA